MVASVVEQILKDHDQRGGENANPPTESDEYQRKYAEIAMMVSFNTGAIRLLFGMLRAGKFITIFMSKPIMTGFITAAALIILIEQIKALLGEQVGRYHLFYETLLAEIHAFSTIHPLTLTISGISLFILFLPKMQCIHCIRRIPKWIIIPIPLVVVMVNILLSFFFDFESHGVVVVGNDIKTGFLPPSVPRFKYFTDTFFGAFIVVLVSYMGSMALAVQFDQQTQNQYKSQQQRYREAMRINIQNEENHQSKPHDMVPSQDLTQCLLDQQPRDSNGRPISKPMPIPSLKLDANSEFVAYGLSNLVGSFFGAMVVSASYSRSALNFEMNAVTPFSQIVQALICTLCLLVAMPALSPLPKCVLSAVVTVSVNRLLRNGIAEWRFLWAVSKVELFEFSVALIAPLVIGLEIGIFVAIAASVFLNFILRNSAVLVAINRLIPIDGGGGYVDERIVHRMNAMKQQRNVNPGNCVESESVDDPNGLTRDGRLSLRDGRIALSTGGQAGRNEDGQIDDKMYIMELNAQLSYINVRTLMDKLTELITSSKHKEIRYIIVSLGLTAFVDTTTMRNLTALFQDLMANQKYLGFSNCKLSVFRSFKKFETRTHCCFAENNVKLFLTTEDAVSYFKQSVF